MFPVFKLMFTWSELNRLVNQYILLLRNAILREVQNRVVVRDRIKLEVLDVMCVGSGFYQCYMNFIKENDTILFIFVVYFAQFLFPVYFLKNMFKGADVQLMKHIRR